MLHPHPTLLHIPPPCTAPYRTCTHSDDLELSASASALLRMRSMWSARRFSVNSSTATRLICWLKDLTRMTGGGGEGRQSES